MPLRHEPVRIATMTLTPSINSSKLDLSVALVPAFERMLSTSVIACGVVQGVIHSVEADKHPSANVTTHGIICKSRGVTIIAHLARRVGQGTAREVDP